MLASVESYISRRPKQAVANSLSQPKYNTFAVWYGPTTIIIVLSFCSEFPTLYLFFYVTTQQHIDALTFCPGKLALFGARMKTVRIFFDSIRDRIRFERFRTIRILVRIFNIRYRIRIQILKSHIYDVDIQSYPIRHG